MSIAYFVASWIALFFFSFSVAVVFGKREVEQVYKVRGIKAMMARLENDATLTRAQKIDRMKEYERMIAEIDKENMDMWKAYKRIKARTNTAGR